MGSYRPQRSLLEGSTASAEEESLQMSKTVALVGGRLNDVKSGVSDGTISAASCLAFAKVGGAVF